MVLNYIKILKYILYLKKAVVVVADIMFVNVMEFLVNISIHVKFTTVQYLGKITTGNIYKCLDNINDVYYIRGMYVEIFYMNRVFENLRRRMPGISTLNKTATAEHVPEIERKIRAIKERMRAICSTLPFNEIIGRAVI